MGTQYATGKRALAICDVCGFTIPYTELVYQIYNMRNQKLKVCEVCNDQDHPQLQVGRIPVNDPQGLYEPRPDTGIFTPVTAKNSRYLFSWNPVGANLFKIRAYVGQVTARGS
jgi:hypothetical protein